MNSFAKAKIERAKRTLVGRIVCRLFGDQTGAVLMEYVVLGVLVVAAAVAMVALFGKEIRHKFLVMIHATDNDQEQVQNENETRRGERPGDVDDAENYAKDVTNE
jgi:Flp pilus assembly pilin Flp